MCDSNTSAYENNKHIGFQYRREVAQFYFNKALLSRSIDYPIFKVFFQILLFSNLILL